MSLKIPAQYNFGCSTVSESVNTGQLHIRVADIAQFNPNGGVAVIDRLDSFGNVTPSRREFVEYLGVDGKGSLLTQVTRGVAGSTVQAHASGAVIEDVMVVPATIGNQMQPIPECDPVILDVSFPNEVKKNTSSLSDYLRTFGK